ncbi:unnamed protein product, partial [marine sediment metagenome]
HNSVGTLGNGTLEDSDIPVQVLNLDNVVAIDLTEGIGVAADREGNIWFWGNLIFSSVMHPNVTAPVKISYLEDVKSINVLGGDVNLLKDDGTIWHIKLDETSLTKFIDPVKILDINNVRSISESLALKNDGTLCALRDSEQSQGGLIDGVQDIIGLANVYNRRTVILKEDGTVWAWGLNDFGQLGNGSLEDSDVPVRVSNLTDIVAISANYDYNLALKKDGTVWFWGLEKPAGDASLGRNIPVRIKNFDYGSLIYAAPQ